MRPITFEQFINKYDFLVVGEWNVTDTGVYKFITKGKKVLQLIASPIPILPTALLENMDSQIEKIELRYLKNNREYTLITDRATIASRSTIVKLANDGVEVTSENAAALVSFLSDVISSSLSVIPTKPARSVLGWVDDKFVPYTDDVCFDGDKEAKYLFRSMTSKGTLEQWTEYLKPLRNNLLFRLTMAASFASPLIDLVGENPFVFHLWGGTGSGKTVALMAAMSIWGNPKAGYLTRTMNMTQNAMLSTAAFLNNVPFGGDELQTIKSQWTNYDQLIMRVTEGIDRGRMTYNTLNEMRSWKCSFLFTGEEPCIKASSGGGAKNRVIEAECNGKIVPNGNETAEYVRQHFGKAAPVYIDKVNSLKADIPQMYRDLFKSLLSLGTTDKQAGAMALILTADSIASELFWPGEIPILIPEVAPFLSTTEEVDISERAYRFVLGLISENQRSFDPGGNHQWGVIRGNGLECCFNHEVLRREMSDAGFELDAVKKKWREQGYIRCDPGRFTSPVTIQSIPTSCIVIRLPDYDQG